MTTINTQEIAKFSALAQQWWNKEGDLKTLHDINPTRLAYIRQQAELTGKRVLDLGCGGGILTEALAKEGAIVMGVDVEKEAIAVARAHAETQRLPIEYRLTAIEALDSEPFDIITCMEMLEHVADPSLVIAHCARLLRPGGYLFLSTINRNLKAYAAVILAAEYLLGLLPRQTHDYDKFIKPSELASLARREGLKLIGLRGIGYNPFSRKAWLDDRLDVNYIMAYQTPYLS